MSAHPSGWYSGEAWVAANGWTPTDLIFPFFLFIVGVSMVMSFAARRARGDSRAALMRHAVRRTALILLIGYAIYVLPFFNFSHLRYPGVLQRIALVYLCAAAITLWTSTRGRILWIAALLAGYYAVSRFIPVPGCDPSAWFTQHCSLAGYIDRQLMPGHLYRLDFDPEGLLSTFPSIASTLLGTLAGEFLRGPSSLRHKLRGLIIVGLAGVAAGYAWHPWFPIYKPLWSSSYVLLMAGAACLVLALCWWLIEMRGWRAWAAPFLWLGSNAILVYALSSFMSKLGFTIKFAAGAQITTPQNRIYSHWFASLANDQNASLLFALSYTAFWTLAAGVFYWRRIFVKV
jgi:predicted acyltransferase